MGITPSAERFLTQAEWPGNIRELRNVIERACIMCDGHLLGERDLQRATSVPVPTVSARAPAGEAAAAVEQPDANLLSTAQREQIRRVLRETAGNKAAAARLLGVSRRSLYRWLERLNTDV